MLGDVEASLQQDVSCNNDRTVLLCSTRIVHHSDMQSTDHSLLLSLLSAKMLLSVFPELNMAPDSKRMITCSHLVQ